MRNQLAGLPFGGGLLGGAGDGTGGMDEDTSTSLMAGLQKYLGGKDAANQQATLSDREISARNNITITPKQDRPTLLHQSFVPQSAQANRPKYNVGTDIGTIDDRQFLGLAVQALVDDGYMNMPDEVKSAIIERLPAIRNQLPASLVSRAEELR